MRGLGTQTGNVWSGYIRRINEGTIGIHGVAQGANSMWHLVTNDLAATVQGAGYFNTMVDQMQKGDIITAVMDRGGATPVLKNYVVTGNSGTVITTALQTVA